MNESIRERLEDLDLDLLRQRKSEKWSTHARDVLPAWVAEMDYPLAEPITRALQTAVDHWDVGYPLAARATGIVEAFAQRMTDRFEWPIEPERVEVLSDVVQGLYIALETFSEPGGGAVVQTPIYPPFLGCVERSGRRLVENRLVPGPGGFEIDFDGLRRSIEVERPRMLLLCNPHNPSGRVLRRDELERIADLALEFDQVVVMDEIHCDLVHDGRAHIPFATLSEEVASRTITLNSASKSFNIPGLRCAVAHFGSEALHHRFVARYDRHVRGGLGILGLYASIAAWQEGQPWLDAVRALLRRNRDHMLAWLAQHLPGIRTFPVEGTYLAFMDCAGLGLPAPPARHFLRHGRVAVNAGSAFGGGFDSYVRLNFATSPAILDQVLGRMRTAVESADPAV